MGDLEDWFAQDPNRKWMVGIGFCLLIVVLFLFLRAGPDDAVEDYLMAISDMEYREAAAFHMNDDGSWMGDLSYWDTYFSEACGYWFSACNVSNLEITNMEKTNECVAYASDITIVSVSYTLTDRGGSSSYISEDYPTAKHEDGGWGIHLGGNFPNTFSC